MSSANQGVKIIGDDDVKASVTEKGAKAAIAVEILDASGSQITDFTGTVSAATTPTIYNIGLPTANVEQFQVLPPGAKKLLVRSREISANLKVAFISGGSSSTYFTIPFGGTLNIENVSLTGVTLYVQSSQSGNTCEIIAFT